ncbi:MAG: hypothetical protein O9342_07950 [Beijerinckiaceae bacterium]|nr:hypothetical protein [Beijerinckiaceae bacterium]
MASKGQTAERADTRLKITRAEDAEMLVGSALDALDRLEPLIEEETRLFKAGKARDALTLAVEKNNAAQGYTRCLEALKHNAIAIGRFQPPNLEALRGRHEAFSAKMALNMAVVATARTVSEGLLRDLADAVGKNGSPKTYIRGGVTRKAGTAPLAISKAM